MILSDENLTKMRKQLPYGSAKLIAGKLGCTICTVSRVLHGASDYPGVIEEALSIIKDQQNLVVKAEKILSNGR